VEEHDSPRCLLTLFLANNNHDRNHRQQKQVLLQAVEDFNKPCARRFFAGLSSVLQPVLDSELYVPESAFDEGDDTQDVIPDAASSEHLQLLQYAALLLQIYFDALAVYPT
jgi:hypothetical protein